MRYRWVHTVWLWVVFSLAAPTLADGEVFLEAYCDRRGVPRLSYSVPEEAVKIELWRSTTDLAFCQDRDLYPIARYPLDRTSQTYIDEFAPQGVLLHYQIKVYFERSGSRSSGVVAVETPRPAARTVRSPYIMIDKLSYTLFLMDGGTVVRTLPIALGANPTNRKLHLDRASTPEGLYQITGRQPRAQFYRAFDIDYPNAVDRERYALCEELGLLPYPSPNIGGEIQIHGEGIDGNWTWGCVALRNRDIDWLFSLPELREGVMVAIAGTELTVQDLEAISKTTHAERQKILRNLKFMGIQEDGFHQTVGRFQHQARLPITGQLDLKTREALRRTFAVWSR